MARVRIESSLRIIAVLIAWNLTPLWSSRLKSICQRRSVSGLHGRRALDECKKRLLLWQFGPALADERAQVRHPGRA